MISSGIASHGERARADAFFTTWHARHGAYRSSSDVASWLHEQLLDATFEEAPSCPAQRRLAISTPGVPVVYSHKCTRRRESPRFRMLAEPGGTATTVAEQIVLSRDLLHRISCQLGWQRATGRIDAVLDLLLPSDPEAFAEWHGGLGFGLEVGDGGPELRLYCNVRQGDLTSRWQRFADAVGELADESAEPAFREILHLAAPRTFPVGLALAIGGGELRGIRLYCGLSDATSDSAIAAAPGSFAESASVIRRFVDSYRASLGDLGEHEITLGYDFAARNELLWPAVMRYKVDLWCEEASNLDRARLIAWAEDQIESFGMDRSGLRSFFTDLDGAFDGWTLQYLSLGCRNGSEELTAYCIPGWRDVRPGNTAEPRRETQRELPAAIGNAVDRGIAYLLARRNARGWWNDFQTLAGPGTEWVSAFVAFALASTNRAAALAAAHATWSRLHWRRWWSAGWGYNRAVPSDADSTIWALRLAAAVDAPSNGRALRFLARHVTSKGALATYASAGPIRAFTRLAGTSFAGWCGPHACVSAAGASLPELPHRQRVLAWLRGAQHSNGHWTSYWWTTPHYATALAAEALADASGPGDADRVSLAVQWVADDLLRRAKVMTPFEQAFALRTLLLGTQESAELSRILGDLARTQRADGSWSPSARLRIPPPDVIDPDGYTGWVEGALGGGSIQVDHEGCFTTAAVLLALRRAEERAPARITAAGTSPPSSSHPRS